jgi:hypothetical protein
MRDQAIQEGSAAEADLRMPVQGIRVPDGDDHPRT